jgi:hypothetical protein
VSELIRGTWSPPPDTGGVSQPKLSERALVLELVSASCYHAFQYMEPSSTSWNNRRRG